MSVKQYIGRRKFLKVSTLGLVSAGISAGQNISCLSKKEKKEEKSLRIKGYRMLGRTGFRVSEIGCGNIQDAGLLSAMLDAGVNYIDTAESYPGHHRIVGRAIRGRDRKSVFITTKMQMEGDVSVQGLVKRVDKALEELETDYVDCMMMHMPEKAETLGHKNFHQAMKRLKSEGKVRFLGVSHHGSFWLREPEESMEKVLLAAAEDGRFDVFLLAYNFLQMDQGKRVLEVCGEKEIGTALMKTTPVYRYYLLKSRIEKLEKEGKKIHPLYREGLKRFKEKADMAEAFIKENRLEDPEEIREAAIKFVLSNPEVNTVCCSIRTYKEMERMVRLSGKKQA
ncbi:MAG: aldo/keto reductase [Candidatus Aminicenantales bacterium]